MARSFKSNTLNHRMSWRSCWIAWSENLKRREFFSRQIILLSSGGDELETSPAKGYGGWKLLNMREAEGTKDLDSEDVLSVSGDSSSEDTQVQQYL